MPRADLCFRVSDASQMELGVNVFFGYRSDRYTAMSGYFGSDPLSRLEGLRVDRSQRSVTMRMSINKSRTEYSLLSVDHSMSFRIRGTYQKLSVEYSDGAEESRFLK